MCNCGNHQKYYRGYLINKEVFDDFDNLPDLENVLWKEQKMTLFYIAGYIIRTADDSSDDVLLNDTNFYYPKNGDFV